MIYKITQYPTNMDITHTEYIIADSLEEAKEVWHKNDPFPYFRNEIVESTLKEAYEKGFYILTTKYGDYKNEEIERKIKNDRARA